MKHAGAAALERLSGLLAQVRLRPGLREKKLGIFYRGSKSFLHFHEDPQGLFADISTADGFNRLAVNIQDEWAIMLRHLDAALAQGG